MPTPVRRELQFPSAVPAALSSRPESPEPHGEKTPIRLHQQAVVQHPTPLPRYPPCANVVRTLRGHRRPLHVPRPRRNSRLPRGLRPRKRTHRHPLARPSRSPHPSFRPLLQRRPPRPRPCRRRSRPRSRSPRRARSDQRSCRLGLLSPRPWRARAECHERPVASGGARGIRALARRLRETRTDTGHPVRGSGTPAVRPRLHDDDGAFRRRPQRASALPECRSALERGGGQHRRARRGAMRP
jgi:hypothetical protein